MRTIPVDVYPLKMAYHTPEAAIAGAKNHPFQAQAGTDTARLAGTAMIDAFWTDADFCIRFSNGLWLHVHIADQDVVWDVSDQVPCLGECDVERVGAPPVVYQWRPDITGVVDRSALVAKRRGAEFRKLFATGVLYVYTRTHLILQFAAVRRTDTDTPILYVTEDE